MLTTTNSIWQQHHQIKKPMWNDSNERKDYRKRKWKTRSRKWQNDQIDKNDKKSNFSSILFIRCRFLSKVNFYWILNIFMRFLSPIICYFQFYFWIQNFFSAKIGSYNSGVNNRIKVTWICIDHGSIYFTYSKWLSKYLVNIEQWIDWVEWSGVLSVYYFEYCQSTNYNAGQLYLCAALHIYRARCIQQWTSVRIFRLIVRILCAVRTSLYLSSIQGQLYRAYFIVLTVSCGYANNMIMHPKNFNKLASLCWLNEFGVR